MGKYTDGVAVGFRSRLGLTFLSLLVTLLYRADCHDIAFLAGLA